MKLLYKYFQPVLSKTAICGKPFANIICRFHQLIALIIARNVFNHEQANINVNSSWFGSIVTPLGNMFNCSNKNEHMKEMC